MSYQFEAETLPGGDSTYLMVEPTLADAFCPFTGDWATIIDGFCRNCGATDHKVV